MGAFLDYIFQNNHYREVQKAFDLVHSSSLQNAFDVWQKNKGLALEDNYTDKELIFEHIEEIKTLDKWIRTTHWLMSKMNKGVEWLYCVNRGMKSIPVMNYKEYEFIMNNEYKIKTYDRYNSTYSRLLSTHREAIQWLYYDTYGVSNIPNCSYKEIEFIATNETKIRKFQELLNECNRIIRSYREASERLVNKKYNTLTFADKKKIADSEKQIKEIDEELKRIKKLRETYPLAWQKFSNGKNLDNLTLAKLKTADKRRFKIKDAFLKYWDMNPELVKLILGVKKPPITSFDDAEIEKEQSVLDYMENNIIGEYTPFSKNVHLDTSNELKRAIMDSMDYGIKCSFSDSFDISKFYSFRNDFDKIGIYFDEAIKKEKDNDFIVREFNKVKYGKEESYIEDYLRVVTENSELYNYIELYKQEKEKREEAKLIQKDYPLGQEALFGALDFDSCGLLYVQNVIDAKASIIAKEVELREMERLREEERIKNDLLSKTSSWGNSIEGLHYDFLLKYYPTTCDFEASQSEWDDRWTVWNFKNTPEKTSQAKHSQALDLVIPQLKTKLNSTFGQSSLKYLTLVCIPASSAAKTQARYKEFSQRLCRETGMINAYDHMDVVSSSEEKKFGGSGVSTDNVSFDSSFFRGKYVILFDDVITKGESMLRFKRKMESLGATVVGGLSIGKTTHSR